MRESAGPRCTLWPCRRVIRLVIFFPRLSLCLLSSYSPSRRDFLFQEAMDDNQLTAV